MFKKVDVPIIGLIENMSHYCCPKCGHEDNIFGHGGAQEQAKELNIPFLGEIPLNAEIRLKADQGEPISEFYSTIVQNID
jgi:ATP-binding protein involved in chromosome partitioning